MEGESMGEYGARLESVLAAKEPFTTYNRDIFHAFAIIIAVFRHAEREVLLLSHELERNFFGRRAMLGVIDDFLKTRKGRLRILVEKSIDADHPMLELAECMPEQVSICRIPVSEQDYDYNFAIMDDCGYRYERDRNSKTAIASFHDAEAKVLVRKMSARFERLAAKSLPLATAGTAF